MRDEDPSSYFLGPDLEEGYQLIKGVSQRILSLTTKKLWPPFPIFCLRKRLPDDAATELEL